MAISEQLRNEIEQEITGVAVIKRPGYGQTDFMTEFSRVLAQTTIDRIPLEKAKFDFAQIPKFEAYLELLSYAMGEKGASLGVKDTVVVDFDKLMEIVRGTKKVLLKFVKFILEETQSNEVQKAYDYIKKGYGDIDDANDCIMMVAFARKNMGFAEKIAPLGKEINEQLLQEVESAAIAVLRAKGVTISTPAGSTTLVDRQDRLISLCIDALTKIRRFADKAFEEEYYDKYYANRVKRAMKQSPPSPEKKPPELVAAS